MPAFYTIIFRLQYYTIWHCRRTYKYCCYFRQKKYKNLNILISCLLPIDDTSSVKRSLVCAVNFYLKDLCSNTQFYYIDLAHGWILNKHLNSNLFLSDKISNCLNCLLAKLIPPKKNLMRKLFFHIIQKFNFQLNMMNFSAVTSCLYLTAPSKI